MQLKTPNKVNNKTIKQTSKLKFKSQNQKQQQLYNTIKQYPPKQATKPSNQRNIYKQTLQPQTITNTNQ